MQTNQQQNQQPNDNQKQIPTKQTVTNTSNNKQQQISQNGTCNNPPTNTNTNIMSQQQDIYKVLSQKYSTQLKQLIQQIRDIQNSQAELQLQEQLTQQIKQGNVQKIRDITKKVIGVQNCLQILGKYQQQDGQSAEKNGKQADVNIPSKQKQQLKGLSVLQQKIAKQSQSLNINEQTLTLRYNQLVQQPNDSNWTDATQSQADDDQIWVVDQQIMKAMEQEQDIDEEEGEDDDGDDDKQGMQESDQNKNKKQQINIDELQEQFITGQQSDHLVLYGKHDKFCISVNGLVKQDLLLSGGGDDYMYMYKLLKDEASITNNNKDKCIAPYHIVRHTQTVQKVQISYSKQYIFTMTDNEVLCTQIKTKQTTKLKCKQVQKEKQRNKGQAEKQKQQQAKQKQNKKQSKLNKNNKQKQESSSESGSDEDEDSEPICSDMVCHHLGDVVALSSGYQLQIYNIKGLKHYQTYYCDSTINMIKFTQAGKQLILACDDNRLRLLTPKTSEIVTVAGVKQHQSQISVIKTKGDIILSGCIDGYIGITTIKKAAMTTLIGAKQTEDLQGAINQLEFAGNYFISSSSADRVDWYDLSKAKKLFQSPTEGSCSDICWQGNDYQHLYNLGTIKGYIHIFDCRNPLKQINKTRAGNTIHQLWAESWNIVAACEDGHVRQYDIRKLI